MDFGEGHDRSGNYWWSKNDSIYLHVKPKVFKTRHNKDFRLRKNLQWESQTWISSCDGGISCPCSRKLWSRGELVSSADTNSVRRHGGTTQTGSQVGWRSTPGNQKDLCDSAAVDCGQTRQFLFWSPIICKEEVGTRSFNELSMWTMNWRI